MYIEKVIAAQETATMQEYKNTIAETWEATWTMATMEMSKRALQADPTNS